LVGFVRQVSLRAIATDEITMRRFGLRLAALLFVSPFLLPPSTLRAEAPVVAQHSEAEQANALIAQARRVVSENFYNPDGLAPFLKTLEAAQASTRAEAGSIIDAALAALGVSHTIRLKPNSIEYFELMDVFRPAGSNDRNETIVPGGRINYDGIGLVTREIEGRLFAAMIYHGSAAERAGVLKGDEIVSVDGQPYDAIASFKDRAESPVMLAVRGRADETPRDISVVVESIAPGESLRDAIRNSVRIVEQDGQKIGYLRVWTFASRGMYPLLTRVLSSEPLRSADGLVLDLRSRWGGTASEAADLFLGRSREMSIVNRNGRETVVVTRWRKPLVAIVDQGTRSSMEIFAHSLQQAGISLIGTRSAGAVLAARGFMLDDNSLIVLAVNDVKIDGARMEGIGVTPDIIVPHDIRYAAGADPQFDRALQELNKRLIH
jgi:carboxyl-terminal processing protease